LNFYPVPGLVTSLISLPNGAPVGLGIMLEQQLARTKRVLFCPSADQDSLAWKQLENVGVRQAQSDYYYRHASGGDIYTDPGTGRLKLGNQGANSQGVPIRALAYDVNFLCDPFLANFGIHSRTSHRKRTVNVLYVDGHAVGVDNRSGDYTVDARMDIYQSLARVLAVFELLDREP